MGYALANSRLWKQFWQHFFLSFTTSKKNIETLYQVNLCRFGIEPKSLLLAILSGTKYFNLFNIAMFAFLITVSLLQKSCIDFAINATPLERYMPEERVGFKYRLWRIVESTPFEYFIMTLIVLNTILLMMKVCAVLFFLINLILNIYTISQCVSIFESGKKMKDTHTHKVYVWGVSRYFRILT